MWKVYVKWRDEKTWKFVKSFKTYDRAKYYVDRSHREANKKRREGQNVPVGDVVVINNKDDVKYKSVY